MRTNSIATDQATFTDELPGFDAWRQAIGAFMVSFNECEHWIYMFIDALVGPHLAEVIAEERLQKRSRAAEAAVKDLELGIDEAEIDQLFARLRQLADYRNVLAHNAPMVQVYEHTTGGSAEDLDYQMRIELRSRKGRKTSLEEIQTQTLEAEELSERLALLLTKISRKLQERRS